MRVDGNWSPWSTLGSYCVMPTNRYRFSLREEGKRSYIRSATLQIALALQHVLLIFRLALVSCGGGVMTVYRSCTNPAPQGGGANCSGLARMDQACNVNPCPLESGQCGFF